MPEKDQLTLEGVDHETCDSCNFKFDNEECKECLFYILKKDKGITNSNHVKDVKNQ